MKRASNKEDSSAIKVGSAHDNDLAIIALGASAGGLEPLKNFFKNVPSDSNLTFIIISHLEPDHKSMLAEILRRHTAIPVEQITETSELQAGRIFIIPPNKNLAIESNQFVLHKIEKEKGINLPIDFFLRSMAENFQDKCLAVILSGTMSDGCSGIKAVKENGGLVIAQNPNSAEFAEMPKNAIDTGMVDLVLEVDEMPGKIAKYFSHSYLSGQLPLNNLDDLEQILAIVGAAVSYDFRFYKKNTMIRRILRRMGLNNIENMKQYIKLLKDNAVEVQSLFNDLLIGVTEFFRDKEVWQLLKENLLKDLVFNLPPDDTVRVWVPGCSTGEEAYSIAIILSELFDEADKPYSAQIFATDIDAASIATARAGLYGLNIADQVSENRLNNYFSLEENGYRISRQIRESIIFAEQNLISDAPFSNLDLISCRNLLIYLEADVQRSIIDLFSFSLREKGILVLGISETVGYKNNSFEQISKKNRIFQLRSSQRPERKKESSAIANYLSRKVPMRDPRLISQQRNLESIMHANLLKHYAPAAVITDTRGQIVYFYGQTEKYLNLPKNEPVFDLISMCKEGLKTRLRTAIHKARKENSKTSLLGQISVAKNENIAVLIDVVPLNDEYLPDKWLLVTFNEDDSAAAKASNCEVPIISEDSLVKQLESELAETKDDLQNTIEELETSNEELKASNEEMMSMNEELQSTNEELETSKEELQTLNDNLNSLNIQLREKLIELEETNNDLINLMNSTQVATVFLDRNAVIRRFTPAAKNLFSLIPSDVGRPINDLSSRLRDEQLESRVSEVLHTLVSDSKEIETADGSFFLRRIIPFRTEDNRIDGVVLTFVDITRIKKGELAVKASEAKYRETNQLLYAVLNYTHILSAYLDRDFNFIWVNKAFAWVHKQTEDFFPGKNNFTLFPNAENKAIFQQVVETGQPYHAHAKPLIFSNQPERGLTYWDWSLIPVKDDNNRVATLVFTLADVTQRIRAEIAHREETRSKTQILESITDGFYSLNNNLEVTYFNQAATKILGKSADEILGKNIFEAFPQFKNSIFDQKYKEVLNNRTPDSFEIYFETKPYENWWNVRIHPFSEGISVYFTITTEQKKTEQFLKEQTEALKRAQKAAHIGSWDINCKTGEMICSDELLNIFGISETKDTVSLVQKMRNAVHPEDKAAIEEFSQRVEKGIKPVSLETRIIRPDGQTKTIWTEISEFLTDNEDKPLKISGIVHDISDRKKMEQERLRLEKIANRNQKLEALGALAGGIAHNFNNFLCGIFGNIELAMEERDPDRAAAFLKSAMHSMEPAKALTRQLITFSRGGEPEKTVGPVFTTVIDAINFALAGSNIKLHIKEIDNLWKCNFDGGQISQVINNLVINSRQAMPDGGEITVSAINQVVKEGEIQNLFAGNYVRITFSDNGPGIPEKFASHIFDPFFSTKQGNQGLGLAISYSIVSRHGGTMTLNYSGQKGTSFNIYIPAVIEEQVSSVSAKTVDSTAVRVKGQGMILVMDDEKVVRDVLKEMLLSLGFVVKTVNDGQQAIEELASKKNQYRAAILDLTVPGNMGGKEACEILRDSGITIPIFAASGYSSDPVIMDPESFGFDNSLAKPFSISELSEVLKITNLNFAN